MSMIKCTQLFRARVNHIYDIEAEVENVVLFTQANIRIAFAACSCRAQAEIARLTYTMQAIGAKYMITNAPDLRDKLNFPDIYF